MRNPVIRRVLLFNHQPSHAASVILSIAYGIEIASENDPHVSIAEKALRGLAAAVLPGAHLVVRTLPLPVPILSELLQLTCTGEYPDTQVCATVGPRSWLETTVHAPLITGLRLLTTT